MGLLHSMGLLPQAAKKIKDTGDLWELGPDYQKPTWCRHWADSPSDSGVSMEKAMAVLLPGKSHGRRSLDGCSPCGCWGLDMTERLHFHFSVSCIGEGNGNPLQCSCLENPRDGGAWCAAVYGVTQSWTRLSDLAAAAVATLSYSASLYVTVVLYAPL